MTNWVDLFREVIKSALVKNVIGPDIIIVVKNEGGGNGTFMYRGQRPISVSGR
jgi:hypothetical protein